MNKDDKVQTNKIKGEAATFLTGSVIFGGSKLVYEIGKDVVSYFKSDRKMFLQLLVSHYSNNQHIVIARIASSYVHSINVESLYIIKGKQKKKLETYSIKKNNSSMGFDPNKPQKKELLQYPFHLLPSQSIDMYIRIPEITDTKKKKNRGIKLYCDFSPIDTLKKLDNESIEVRLRWQ